jgi:dCMP deaminase
MKPSQDFLRDAYRWADYYSDDPNTKNGAVLVAVDGRFAYGTNRLPAGLPIDPRYVAAPLKYQVLTHAERDAILNAARLGIPTDGATLYCPYAACSVCAQAIETSGVAKVVAHRDCMDKMPERWRESVELGDLILDSAGVERVYFEGPINGVSHLFDGQVWLP